MLAQDHKRSCKAVNLRHLRSQNYTALLTMYVPVSAKFLPNRKYRVSDTAWKEIAPMGSLYTLTCISSDASGVCLGLGLQV